MNTIKVEPAKLKSAANQFNSIGNQIRSLTQNMTQTVNQITSRVWTGDASRVYAKKFNNLQDDINRMVKMINEHVEDLNKMAAEFEKAENANQQAANSLKDDVIS